MTRMIPATVDPAATYSEKAVFRWVEKGSRDWVCLHSLGLSNVEGKRAGEIDFLLLTPKGIFSLEVKGSFVAHEDGLWRYASYSKRESPFEQAKKGMFSVMESIRKHFGVRSALARAMHGHGVVMAHMHTFDCSKVATEADHRLLALKADLEGDPSDYVERLLDYARAVTHRGHTRRGLSADQMKDIAELLRGDARYAERLSLFSQMVRGEQNRLTDEQSRVFSSMELSPRHVVHGTAGTGKTLLAVHKARRAASLGRRVTLLVYNKMLAAHLSAGFRRSRSEGGAPNVEVNTITGFLYERVRRSAFADELPAGKWDSEIYLNVLPKLGALAGVELREDERREDELVEEFVFDEAQDFLTRNVLDALEPYLVQGFQGGRFSVFLDANNQAGLYGHFEHAALEDLEARALCHNLHHNYRNTEHILRDVEAITEPNRTAICSIEGAPVQWLSYRDDASQAHTLREVLEEMRSGGICPGQVTVLLPRDFDARYAALLSAHPNAEQFNETHAQRWSEGVLERGVTASTISSFKGLENDHVIVADVDDLGHPWLRSALYIAMTRARVTLYVLIREDQWPARDAALSVRCNEHPFAAVRERDEERDAQRASPLREQNAQELTKTAEKMCPKCAKSMVVRFRSDDEKRESPFWGCSAYPSCNAIVQLLRDERRAVVGAMR